MSEVAPSCMRAPPETVKPTTGRPSARARSKQRVIFSPTALPMDPIMKAEFITKRAQRSPPMVACPHTTASRSREAASAAESFSW